MPRTAARTSAARSRELNSGRFSAFSAMATITRSNNTAARRTTSRCPFVIGSKLPG